MAFVRPASPRAVTTDRPEGLEIAIPSRKNPLAIAFLSLWLIGLVFGEVFGLRILLFPPENSSAPVVLISVWLVGDYP